MNEIVVSHEKPPIYDRLHSCFGVDWDDGLIIAFDGKIHSKGEPQPSKIVHEAVHLERQSKIGNANWWKLYFESDSFRLEEEKLAYMAEAAFIKKYVKNRDHRFSMIRQMAHAMSDGIYGKIISKDEAFKLLK